MKLALLLQVMIIPLLVGAVFWVIRRGVFGRPIIECSASLDIWSVTILTNLVAISMAQTPLGAHMGQRILSRSGETEGTGLFTSTMVAILLLDVLMIYFCSRMEKRVTSIREATQGLAIGGIARVEAVAWFGFAHVIALAVCIAQGIVLFV